MNKKYYILSIIFILLSLIAGKDIFAQTLNSTGKINNKTGTIIIKGQATIKQDTLNGKVKYTMDDANNRFQYIEQITYDDLEFSGKSNKVLRGTKNLIILQKFTTAKDLTVEIKENYVEIETKGTTSHDARINPNYTYGKVKMNGVLAQDVWGNGQFKELELDNTAGADVRNGGGFSVNKSLTLTKGEFRNDSENNFIMADSTEIIRYAAGSLQNPPIAAAGYSVRYEGLGHTLTTGEIPNDSTVLQNMLVHNADGISLAKKAVVNDSLHVGGSIYTQVDTLVLDSQKNPSFTNANYSAEVIGSMQRTNIKPGKEYVLNNPYTKVTYGSAEDLNGTQMIVSTIYPDSAYDGAGSSNLATRRIAFSGLDAAGKEITGVVKVHYAYGWRHSPDSTIDETHDLVFNEIGLKRWVGDRWVRVLSSAPSLDTAGHWGYGYADTLNNYGQLALGSIDSYTAEVKLMAFLEGAFKMGTRGKMHTDLRDLGLLDNLPDKNTYPVNLIPGYNPDIHTAVPDSVVDYIVIEFRPDRNTDGFYKLGFVRYDGMLVDLEGNELIEINTESGFDTKEDYYVALRHRNHAPVISAKQYKFELDSINPIMQFSNPSFVEGGANAVKLVDIYDIDGVGEVRYYALKAGFNVDANSLDDIINITKNFTLVTDREAAYKMFVNKGYLMADYDLNGLVTTRDYNYSWNNRLNK